MTTSDTEVVVKGFLKEKLLPKGTSIRRGTALFEAGHVDSFGLVELILFLEKTYKFKVRPLEVTLENLGSVEKIVQYLARKGFK